MGKIYEGDFSTPQGAVAIVAARFNHFIVEHLVGGARDGFRRHGMKDDAIDLVWVPGSFEIPPIALKLARSGKYAAIVCLGTVIRGDTDHYEHVASEAAKGIGQVSMMTGIPVIFGILTCETLEQAIHRSGAKAGNKGYEAATTAIEMMNLLQILPGT